MADVGPLLNLGPTSIGSGARPRRESTNTGRAGVQSSFDMGPNTSFQQPARQMKDFSVLPRAAFQKENQGEFIANSLLSFAGVAGEQYVNAIQTKIDEDKIVQTSRAAKALAPTDDATVAGYRAHAAVKAGQLSTQLAAELDAASKAGISDEEWEEKLKQGSQAIDAEMRRSYENYDRDKEIKKLTTLAIREKMLQAGASREIDRVDVEISNRVNTFTDTMVQAIKAPGEDINARMDEITQLGKTLKLTPLQIDKAVLDTIMTDGTLESIALAKAYKGVGRKTSLFERTASLQKLERNLLKEKADREEYDYLKKRRETEASFINGDISEDDFIRYAKTDPTLTPARVNAVWDKRDKFIANQTRLAKVAKDVSDPINRVDPTTSKTEIQAALNQDLETNIRLASEDAKIDQMQEGPDKEKAIREIRSKAIRQTANNALAEGVVLDNYVKDFEQLATTDIALLETQYQNKEGKKVALTYENTPDTFKKAYEAFDSMSPAAQQAHLNAMDTQNADTLRGAVDLIKSGSIDPVEAFRKAQIDARVPKAYKTKEVKKAVDKVIDDLDSWWPWSGLKSVQEAYVNEQVRGELSRSQDPTSDTNIERVSKSFQKQHTISDGIFYYGTSKELTEMTQLNTDKLTDAFSLVKNSPGISERLELASKTYGFDVDDVFAVTNPKTKSFHYRSPDGSYISDEYRLSSLRDLWNEQKTVASKREEEIKSKFTEVTGQHSAVLDSLMTGEPIDPKYLKVQKGYDPKEVFGAESTSAWISSAIKNIKAGISKWWTTPEEREKLYQEREEAKEASAREGEDKYLSTSKRTGVSLK